MLTGLTASSHAQQATAAANAPAQPAPAAPQISIYTKDGRAITTTGVSRSGASIMAKVKLDGGSEGEARL